MKISDVVIRRGSFKELALEYLAALPDDEVVTREELQRAVGGRAHDRYSKELEGLCIKTIVSTPEGSRQRWLFGSRKAIKALQKKLQTL